MASLLNKAESLYVVVEFPEDPPSDDGTQPMEIISSSWIFTRNKILYCYWPSFKQPLTFQNKVKQHASFEKNRCTECPIIVKYASKSYEKALEKIKSLEVQSSVSQTDENSEDETLTNELSTVSRKRKKNTYLEEYECSLSSDDEDRSLPKIKLPVSRSKLPVTPSSTPVSSNSFSASCQCRCGNVERKVNDLIHRLEEIKEGQNYLIRCIQERETNTIELLENPVLKQSSNKEDLETLNTTLENAEQMSMMSASLQTVGGKDVGDNTRRIMTKIMDNNLATMFNWTGRNNKFNFSSFHNIIKLILVAVRKNPLTKNATQDEVEGVIKLWLRNAGDRDGGRNRRADKSNDQSK